MSYTTRLCIPNDEEYEAITALYNLDWPDDPLTVEESKFDDASKPEAVFFQRFLVERDGKLVSEGHYGEMHWAPKPGKYYFIYSIHPDHYGREVQEAFYAIMMDDLQRRDDGVTELVAWSREDKTERIEFFESKGFELAMRFPLSELALDSFDAATVAALSAKVATDGFELFSVTELETLDPDWQQKAWEMDCELRVDIPSVDPMVPRPFDEYRMRFDDPMLLKDAFFFAILTNRSKNPADWRYAGTTALWKSADLQKLGTGFTGVRREFRRHGLATALKVHSIDYAKECGIKRIDTDNEENNPMYQINLRLGFKPRPAFVDYVKKFDACFDRRVEV